MDISDYNTSKKKMDSLSESKKKAKKRQYK